MAMSFSLANATRRIMPPWLQRRVGGAFVLAIGEQLDGLRDRAGGAVALRFPGIDPELYDEDERALGYTGRERQIRRGPRELAANYARRLRGWWDAYRIAGSPYALLGQLIAFTRDWLEVRIDVVAQSGNRHWTDAAGTITHDSITWAGDGSGGWAHLWVFFYVPDAIPYDDVFLVTEAGEFLVTEAGDFLVASTTITPAELSTAEADLFTLIPREWSAGHIPYVTVVLLQGDAALVGYPPRLVGEPGQTVGRGHSPIILRTE